jgi:hypothetical protein
MTQFEKFVGKLTGLIAAAETLAAENEQLRKSLAEADERIVALQNEVWKWKYLCEGERDLRQREIQGE